MKVDHKTQDAERARDQERTLKLTAATILLCMAIGIAVRPDRWWVPLALLGAFAALVAAICVVDRLVELRRRCPRCGQRGFASVQEGERDTALGSLFYRVAHCRRCDLYRLESALGSRDLDPARWWEQLREWEEAPVSDDANA